MSNRELFLRFPRAVGLAHREFATLPTPVENLANTAGRLGLSGLQVKRDDLSGSLYGGNKVRKLEFLLGDAIERGHDEVWTVGGIGSHHCLATCIWARELGLRPGVVHFPQPTTPHVQRNIRALSTTAPSVHLLAREGELTPEQWGGAMRAWHGSHPDVYWIPGGGSSPVGVLGYVNAALEFVAQVERGEAEKPGVIVVAAGTCGTQAGLLLGFQLAEFDVEVRGVRVVDDWIANEKTVQRLVSGASDLLESVGVTVPNSPPKVLIDERFFGAGYGVPTGAGRAALELVGKLDGVTLEPTYTAKAFASIVADREVLADVNVLYWHTLSGADLSDRVNKADLGSLPPEYRRWVEDPPTWENG